MPYKITGCGACTESRPYLGAPCVPMEGIGEWGDNIRAFCGRDVSISSLAKVLPCSNCMTYDEILADMITQCKGSSAHKASDIAGALPLPACPKESKRK